MSYKEDLEYLWETGPTYILQILQLYEIQVLNWPDVNREVSRCVHDGVKNTNWTQSVEQLKSQDISFSKLKLDQNIYILLLMTHHSGKHAHHPASKEDGHQIKDKNNNTFFCQQLDSFKGVPDKSAIFSPQVLS